VQLFYQFLKTTVIGGLLVLVPIAVCAYAAITTVKTIHGALSPIATLLPVQNLGGVAVAEILAILLFIAVCFLLGLLVRTKGGKTLGGWLEGKLFKFFPGYQTMKKLSRQFLGQGEDTLGKPVLIRMGESRQIGFLIEEHQSGEITVFVPLAPAFSFGQIHTLKGERVEEVEIPMKKVFDCLSKVGIGSSAIFSAPTKSLR
jgi:uncharacterized membrane protein